MEMKTSWSEAHVGSRPSEEILMPGPHITSQRDASVVAGIERLQCVCQFTQPNVKRGQQLLRARQLLVFLTSASLASSSVSKHKSE